MKYLLFFRLLLLLFILQACNRNEKEELGTVSFGTNTDILNCIVTPKIYIDNVFKGIVPGYIDSIKNCHSDSTLNIEIPVGHHTYKFIAADDEGNCLEQKTGEFYIEKDGCKKIFLNIGN
jgi:hypothetical protein